MLKGRGIPMLRIALIMLVGAPAAAGALRGHHTSLGSGGRSAAELPL